MPPLTLKEDLSRGGRLIKGAATPPTDGMRLTKPLLHVTWEVQSTTFRHGLRKGEQNN